MFVQASRSDGACELLQSQQEQQQSNYQNVQRGMSHSATPDSLSLPQALRHSRWIPPFPVWASPEALSSLS